ncbi:hypothetical protein ACFC58_24040 [Kitasatospora purpeofusca]|uniref:hypothetical protein n=1 Tax=Kitasatospora purpeofusca TaxID=67352 RepID=UPI0035DE3FBE
MPQEEQAHRHEAALLAGALGPAGGTAERVRSRVDAALDWLTPAVTAVGAAEAGEAAEYAARLLLWADGAAVDPAVLAPHLAGAMDSGPERAAAAAAIADALGLLDPALEAALVRAQEGDSPATHWLVDQALRRTAVRRQRRSAHSRQAPADSAPTAQDAATGPRGGPGPRPAVPAPAAPPFTAPPGFAVLRSAGPVPDPGPVTVDTAAAPLRAALTVDRALFRAICADPRWQRLLLLLYGGAPVRDLADAEARSAAVAARLRTPLPGDRRLELAADADAIAARSAVPAGETPDLAAVTADSPITPLLLATLRAGGSPADLAAELLGTATDPSAGPAARGDAVVGLLAVAETPRTDDELLGLLGEPAVRQRVVWRLHRARVQLADVVAELRPGTVQSAFRGRRPTEPDQKARELAVLRVLASAESVHRGWGEDIDDGLPLSLLSMIESDGPDVAYNLAVALDTAGRLLVDGRGRGLAHTLATLAAIGAPLAGERWPLDPLAPAAGHPLAEALTTLAALTSELAFVRCWMIDRLTDELVAAGYHVEAGFLALADLPTDPVSARRTLARLAAAAGLPGLLGDEPDTALLAALVPDPGAGAPGRAAPEARARVRAAAATGDRIDRERLIDWARRVRDPLDALRLVELAIAEHVVPVDGELLGAATGFADRLASPTERARARSRLARLGAATAPDLTGLPVREAALLLAALPGTVDPSPPPTPEGAAPGAAAEAELREAASGRLAEPLLRQERAARQESEGPAAQGLAWAVLTGLALCDDALAATGTEGHRTRDAWNALSADDPDRAARALRVLLRAGRHRAVALDTEGCAAIDRLLAAGRTEQVSALLPFARFHRPAPALARWRGSAHTEVADLATMLSLDVEAPDEDAIGRLPRLLAHPDEWVRARTWAAFERRPAPFRSSVLGARLLVELARATAAAADRGTRLGLRAALSSLRHDSLPALEQALAELAEEPSARTVLLRHVHRPTPALVRELDGLLRRMDGGDRTRLLTALLAVAGTGSPARAGEELRPLVPVVRDLAAANPGGAGEVAAALLGLIDPSAGTAAFLAAAARPSSPVAGGAVRGLGHLLGAPGLPAAVRAAVVEALVTTAGGGDGPAVLAVYALGRSGTVVIRAPEDPVGWLDGFLSVPRPGAEEESLDEEAGWAAPLLLGDPGPAPGGHRIAEALARRIAEALARRVAHAPSRPGAPPPAAPALAVLLLDRFARERPAAVRSALEADPACTRALRALLTDADWAVFQQAVARILLTVGAYTRDVLVQCAPSPALSQVLVDGVAASEALDERVASVLTAAVTAGTGEGRVPAVRALRAAADRGLSGDWTRAAAEALLSAARRPDASEPVLLPGSDRPLPGGSFAHWCRGTALDLLGVPPLPRDVAGTLTVPLGPGVGVVLPHGATVDGLRQQLDVLTEEHGWSAVDPVRRLLAGRADEAARSGRPLIEVLEEAPADAR